MADSGGQTPAAAPVAAMDEELAAAIALSLQNTGGASAAEQPAPAV
eukprot:SAG31_NODE_23546_length_502_cov_0.751861_1_plen_45_part_10